MMGEVLVQDNRHDNSIISSSANNFEDKPKPPFSIENGVFKNEYG